MIQITEKDIFNEVRDAEDYRNGCLECVRDVVQQWLSDSYSKQIKKYRTLENYTDSFLRFVSTQLVQQRPQVTVSPEVDVMDTEIASAYEGSINYWIKKERMKKVMQRMGTAVVLGWGVTTVYYDTLSGGEGAAQYKQEDTPLPARVCIKTIPMSQYGCDSRCFGYENRRIEFHCYETDLTDLYRNPDFDQKIVRELSPNTEPLKRLDGMSDNTDRISKRDRIIVYEVWLPDQNLLCTLAKQGDATARFLKIAPYEGPKLGPYTLWGALEVPGQIFPYSQAASVRNQQDDYNLHALAAEENANSYKAFGTYDKNNSDDGKAVRTVKNGEMIGLSGGANAVQMNEMGGVSDTQVKILQMFQERLDRNMGYTDAQRGLANSETATANNIADQNSDHRMELLRQAIVDGGENDLRKVMELFSSKPITYPYTTQDRVTGQSQGATLYGGVDDETLETIDDGKWAGQIGKDTSDYHLEIRLDSMKRETDPVRQKRASEELQIVFGQVIPIVGIQNINLRRVIDRYGNSFNEIELSKQWINPSFDQFMPPDPLSMEANQSMAGQMQLGMQGQSPQSPVAIGGTRQGPPAGYGSMMSEAKAGVF